MSVDKNSHKITYPAVRQVLADYWAQYAAHPWRTIVAFLAPAFGSVLIFFVPPLIIARFINVFTVQGISLESSWTYIVLFGITWYAGEIFWRFGLHNLIKVEAAAITVLGRKGFEKLSERDYDFYTNNFVGSLTKTALAYGRGFETLSDTLCFNVIGSLVTVAFALIILSFYSIWISLVLIVCLILAILVALPIIRRRSRLVAERHLAASRVSGRLSDSLTNIMAVKSFAQEKSEMEAYSVLVEDYRLKFKRSYDYQNQRVDMAISPIYVITNVIGLAISIYFSQHFGFAVGTIFVVFSYYSQVTRTFWDINRIYRNVESSVNEAAEFTQMFLNPPAVRDIPEAESLQTQSATVTFENVDFKYEDHADTPSFLNKFNLNIGVNEKVGLVGPSGGGKTTVTKLLLRFIEPQSGKIAIDGHDIGRVTQKSLRHEIAYVPQEPLLFHRSLLENIAYGHPGASVEDVIRVSKIAHAHEFISTLPNGYDTLVGERGIKLSGGQRQRVAIARALLKNSPILVLDEATSSLDSESEKYIQEGLMELMKNKTALIIAHRLSTIKNLDRIVVMDKGRVVQDGKHAELISRPGLYATLWAHQSGEFLA